MTKETRRNIVRAQGELKRFARLLENPDAITALELQNMIPDLEDIAVEMSEAVKEIEYDEEMAVAE